MGKIITPEELRGYLKLSESTIYKLASSGKIPGFKIGNSWRFDMDEITHMIQKARKSKSSFAF